MDPSTKQAPNQQAEKAFTPKRIVQLVLVLILIPLLPMLISGDWNWWEAWFFAISYFLVFVLSRVMVSKRHPDLLAERAHSMKRDNAKSWDKILAPAVALGIVLIPLVAGLDALYDWSPSFSLSVKLIAIVLILSGYVIGTYAMLENRFFSGLVRIQEDRGHKVVSTGPYAWVRHPGYSGTLLSYLASPFLLDTYWGLLAAGLLATILVIRTSLEDRTLQEELDGYAVYAKKVRYRLIPGIW